MAFNASDVVPLSIHSRIIRDARKGLDGVAAGKVKPVRATINALKRKRRAIETVRQ